MVILRSSIGASASLLAWLACATSIRAQDTAELNERACRSGDQPSCVILGLIYETGAAGSRDLGQAAQLYDRACDLGVASGCGRLDFARSEVQPTDEFVRIGYVADALDGKPVAEAIVELRPGGLRAVSDESGRVDFGRLSRGVYRLSATRTGYTASEGELPVPWGHEFLILMEPGEEESDSEGRIFGQVTVAGTDQGLANVDVTLFGSDTIRTVTDTRGRFSFVGLDPSTVDLRFAHLGFQERQATVEVRPGRTSEVYADLTVEPIELDPIEVAVGSGYLERSGFYRRLRQGFGTTFTRHEVEALGPAILSELMWRVPGVSVVSNRNGREVVTTRRTGIDSEQCKLLPWVDGTPLVDGNIDIVNANDLEAMEVYLGAEIPIQYRPPSADQHGTRYPCGVVLIWTRDPRMPR